LCGGKGAEGPVAVPRAGANDRSPAQRFSQQGACSGWYNVQERGMLLILTSSHAHPPRSHRASGVRASGGNKTLERSVSNRPNPAQHLTLEQQAEAAPALGLLPPAAVLLTMPRETERRHSAERPSNNGVWNCDWRVPDTVVGGPLTLGVALDRAADGNAAVGAQKKSRALRNGGGKDWVARGVSAGPPRR
jgi:hypothetical protein